MGKDKKEYSKSLIEEMKQKDIDHIVLEGKEEDIEDWDFDILTKDFVEEDLKKWKGEDKDGK